MKKILYCCFLVLLSCSFLAIKINQAKAVDNLLALCMQPPTTLHSLTPGFMSESFKPTVNRVTSGQVTMAKSGGGSASVTVGISTDGHSVAGGFPSATITVNRAEASIYQFALTANVEPNTTYYLYASSSDASVSWSAVKDYPACYPDGQGLISGENYSEIVSDYDFALYGLNVSTGPVITSLQANTITKTTANIYWATANVMSTSRVNYGTTSSYGSTKYSDYLVNSHILTLDSLSLSLPGPPIITRSSVGTA